MAKLTQQQIEERFWSQVTKGPTCWIWKGSTSGSKTRYGQFRHEQAHRFSYILKFGEVPAGKELHHKCKMKLCVNPDHLEGVDRIEHPDNVGVLRRNRTHCLKGHPYSESNTVLTKQGYRECLICKRDRARNGYQRNRTKYREDRRHYYEKNRDKMLEAMRRYHQRKAAEQKATSEC